MNAGLHLLLLYDSCRIFVVYLVRKFAPLKIESCITLVCSEKCVMYCEVVCSVINMHTVVWRAWPL